LLNTTVLVCRLSSRRILFALANARYSSFEQTLSSSRQRMSVAIHVGQCGNQVAADYWRLAGAAAPAPSLPADDREDAASSATITSIRRPAGPPAALSPSSLARSHLFHPRSSHARCILVDAEPKAVRAAIRAGGPAFHPAHVHTEHRGRGNNWAMGYNFTERRTPVTRALYRDDDDGPDAGGHLADRVLESLRREVEALDAYSGSLMTLSLGGGTGSGVGSRVLERVRDAYPRAFLVAAVVAPSVTAGGSPLQNYNAVLTLRALREHADAVVYRDNDELLRTARYWRALVGRRYDAGYAGSASTSTSTSTSDTPPRPGSSAGASASEGARVSLAEMNEVLAADLAGLTFPVAGNSACGSSTVSWRPFNMGKLVHDLCPMPDARFIDVRSGVLRRAKSSRSSGKRSEADRLVFHAMTALASMMASRPGGDGDGDQQTLEVLAKTTAQAFPRANYGAIASTALVRGLAPSPSSNEVVTRWLDTALPRLAWPAAPPNVMHSPAPPFLLSSNKSQQATASVTMCGNNGHFIPSTRVFLDRARRQFRSRAYLHWYQQHGLLIDGDQDAFREAFEACDSLIGNYEALLTDR
jgi:hypothetical protein